MSVRARGGGWGFLHIPAKRSNPGSRRQSGLGSDLDFSQFPNDFVHIHRLWPVYGIRSVRID